MIIVPVKIQEIDHLAHPQPVHHVPRSTSQEKGESQGMEGIPIPDLSVHEQNHPYSNSGDDDEEGGPYGVGPSCQESEGSPRVLHIRDVEIILYDFAGLILLERSTYPCLRELVEEKDSTEDNDQNDIFLLQGGQFPSIVWIHR